MSDVRACAARAYVRGAQGFTALQFILEEKFLGKYRVMVRVYRQGLPAALQTTRTAASVPGGPLLTSAGGQQ